MILHVVIAALFVAPPAAAPGIVARAEKTDLRLSDGTAVSRVKRDAAGDVTELTLNDMPLKPEEIADLGKLPKLRKVVLFRTNFGDGDVKQLLKCTNLESLNLTSTNVSDDAIPVILEFKNLTYLCLGDVKISPEAVKKLKDGFRSRGQDVRLGYSQRKR
jgi:hypothetical protein